MMTPDHQVRAALKRLKLPPDQRNACRADIENALDIMAKVSISHTILAAQRSKAHSKAKRAYRRALCRLLAASKALLATGGGVPIDLGIERIKRAIHATEPRRFEVLYRAGAKKPTFAVALAYELLEKWKGKPVTTRKGDWWYLASILYGKPSDKPIDLFRHLRDFKPEFSPFRRGRV